jgi:tellurite methyltransferase
LEERVSEEERRRWDERYGSGEYRPRSHPSEFLEAWIDRIPVGRALDVACGAGRNALRLAESGFDVTAVDISPRAIDIAAADAERRELSVEWVVADLDRYEPEPGAFAAVTVFRYANHDLWPRLVTALRPDGWVLIEHHLRTHLDVGGPSSPEFRLRPGELLDAFADLRIVYYSETFERARKSDTSYVLARIAACNGDPGW